MTTTTTPRMSARQVAQAWIATKSAAKRKKLLADVEERAKTSARVRWERMAKAMREGDAARMAYYAAEGKEARAEAAAAFAKPAQPKAKARKAKPALDPSMFEGLTSDQMAALAEFARTMAGK